MPSCSRANELEIINHVNVIEHDRVLVAADIIERPDIERCATLPRSSPNFRLDLSPNLNRPNHIYERLEEPSTSTSSAATHWRFKMFKSVTKNTKQNNVRDGSLKSTKNSSDYDFPKAPVKLADKCFPTKAKNKLKVSPITTNGESSNQTSGSPISLNICFGKKSLHSPSNSQTLEFNDRSREGRDSNRIVERQIEESNHGGPSQPQASTLSNCVYGRVGNTYGRLHVLGSGIGRIERHLSSSCGNIDHYCTPHARHEGNPRFRIENQAVEADRTYQNPDNPTEEGDRIGASLVPADIRGISKSSLQWLMSNRWLPLWVGNSGGKNEYKVIDLDFSLYDDVQYSACTSACTDEHCYGRNVFETCSLYRRSCSRGAGRVCNYFGENEHPPEEINNHDAPADDAAREDSLRNSPENSDNNQNDPADERPGGNLSLNEDCDSPDTSQANNFITQDSITDNDQGLSLGDNEPSTSEGRGMGQHSNSVDTCSPTSPSTPTPTTGPASPKPSDVFNN